MAEATGERIDDLYLYLSLSLSREVEGQIQRNSLWVRGLSGTEQ